MLAIYGLPWRFKRTIGFLVASLLIFVEGLCGSSGAVAQDANPLGRFSR